jgi:hypothetical protein
MNSEVFRAALNHRIYSFEISLHLCGKRNNRRAEAIAKGLLKVFNMRQKHLSSRLNNSFQKGISFPVKMKKVCRLNDQI